MRLSSAAVSVLASAFVAGCVTVNTSGTPHLGIATRLTAETACALQQAVAYLLPPVDGREPNHWFAAWSVTINVKDENIASRSAGVTPTITAPVMGWSLSIGASASGTATYTDDGGLSEKFSYRELLTNDCRTTPVDPGLEHSLEVELWQVLFGRRSTGELQSFSLSHEFQLEHSASLAPTITVALLKLEPTGNVKDSNKYTISLTFEPPEEEGD
jgi:hypothetical protein